MHPQDDACVRNRGELAVYRSLRDARGTQDWVVLHGVPLPEHRSQLIGEADFVIVIPSRAVVVLEVKGWSPPIQPVNYDVWVTAKGHSSNPYAQAAGQRDAIAKALPGIPVVEMVAWTRLQPKQVSMDGLRNFSPLQTLFSSDLSPDRIAAALTANLDGLRMRLGNQSHVGRLLNSGRPTPGDLARAVAVLRPDGEVEASHGTVSRTDLVLQRLDAEQRASQEALAAERHPQVLVTGPAGTGKTVLALDSARREAIAGKRVLYLCSSEALSHWLATQMDSTPESLELCTVKEMLANWLEGSDQLASAGNELSLTARFDVVIADESQYTLGDPESEDCRLAVWLIDQLLVGGWQEGRWRLFGDPYQAGYPFKDTDPLETIRTLGLADPHPREIVLQKSYRSPSEVVDCARVLGSVGWSDLFSRVVPADNRDQEDSDPSWQFVYYRGQQKEALISALQYYIDDLGYSPEDVVVLSTASSSMEQTSPGSSWSPSPGACDESGTNCVGSYHIDEFDGMDSRVVIVTDLFTDFGVDESAGDLPIWWPCEPPFTSDDELIHTQLYRANDAREGARHRAYLRGIRTLDLRAMDPRLREHTGKDA